MPGFELVGREELSEIQKLFEGSGGNLYRYGPNNYSVREFEKGFSKMFGVRYAHAVSSGTAAIHSALAAIGIGPGDEVITSAFTFVAPIEAICALGAVSILVDIDETYHLDPTEVERAINLRTKAVISIPMWAPPKMDELTEICRRRGIVLLEDAAQCLGGTFKGKRLGTFGEMGTFSFDTGKTITTGEGGMVITDDEELYRRVAEFSDHGHMHIPGLPRGQDPRRLPGLNYRMSELAGAVGLAQLEKLDYILAKQKENKSRIKEAISNVPGLSFRIFADEEGALGDTLIFRLSDAQRTLKFARFLEGRGIKSKILPEAFEWHFAGAWRHIFKKFSGYDIESLPSRWLRTYEILNTSIALQVFVNMDERRINEIVCTIKAAASEVLC